MDISQQLAIFGLNAAGKDAGREAQFSRMVERQSRFVFRVAYAILRNACDSEDVAHETFLRIYRSGAYGVANRGGSKDTLSKGLPKVPVVDGKPTTYIDVEPAAQLAKQPLIYQTKWNTRVELQPGTPTTVFSSDDPSSKHQLQLEVTATPLH